MKIRWMAVALAFAASGVALGQGSSSRLATVLEQMNVASTRFQSAEAEFRWDFYERVTKSTSAQTGTIRFQRQKGGTTEMGARIVQPDIKILGYKDGLLQVLDPKANTLIRVAAHGNQGEYESFLTLGFGGSGRELEKAWTITDGGAETIDGVPTEKLDLVSKDGNVRTMFTHVTIWVDPARGVSLKQEFSTPSEDKRTALYTHIRYNSKVERKPYEIKPNGKTAVTTR